MTVRLYLEGIDKGWEIQMPYRPPKGEVIHPSDQQGIDVTVLSGGWYLAEAGVLELFVGFTLTPADGITLADLRREQEYRESLDFDRIGVEDLPSYNDTFRN